MCGIICAIHYGKKKKDPINHHIMNQYEEQYDRGTEGFGLIKIESTKKEIEILRATEPIKALIDLYMNPVMGAIFHHRSPTATKNSLGQTHPIVVEDTKLEFNYAVVHNGCIQNADEMYKKHKELDFLYTTYYKTHYPYKSSFTRTEQPVEKFNDSESLAIELARYLEGKIEKIEAYGSAAFIVLQCSKDWKPIALHFGRNDKNPLKMEKTEESLYLSSEGVGELLTPGIIYTSAIENPSIALTEKPFTMAEPPTIITTYNYGNWGHTRTHKPLYRGMCIADKCSQEKILNSQKCAEHCEPEELKKAYGTEGDNRKTCVYTNCLKKRREGIEYCKKHRNLAEKDLPKPSCMINYPNIDKECSGCEHDKTATQYPIGFKTQEERNKLDTENTEIKNNQTEKDHQSCTHFYEDPELGKVCFHHQKEKYEETNGPEEEDDYTNDDEYVYIDNMIHEFFDTVDNNQLPDLEDYSSLIRSMMERVVTRKAEQIIANGQNPQEYLASMGKNAIEAENYIMAAEEYEIEQKDKLKTKHTVTHDDTPPKDIPF